MRLEMFSPEETTITSVGTKDESIKDLKSSPSFVGLFRVAITTPNRKFIVKRYQELASACIIHQDSILIFLDYFFE